MTQLLTVVLAIALLSAVTLAGMWELRPGRGVQTDTLSRVVSTYRAVELGVGAYRIANGGALPDPDNWRTQIAPYAPYAISEPMNLTWDLGTSGAVTYVCVHTLPGVTVSQDVQRGLQAASDQLRSSGDGDQVGAFQSASNVILAKTCGASTQDTDYDGVVALTFPLQAGS